MSNLTSLPAKASLLHMIKRRSKPGEIHLRIAAIMRRFPDGISGGQIRQELAKEGLGPEEQTHLDRRKRDLKKWFRIEKKSVILEQAGTRRKVTLYKLLGERAEVTDEGQISLRLRAEVIHAAHGRCQMCGRTIEKHGITLEADHKIPREWGGSNDRDNLWAICEDCNAGKKAHFASLNVDRELMKNVTSHESVHVRIGELLKAVGVGKRTPSSLLEIVAAQDDWQKRLRELRYPVIGWVIDMVSYVSSSGKKQVDYVLRSFAPWPDNPSAVVREFERQREIKNRGTSSDESPL